MRVVVTGAAGFIGSHAVERAVARGHEVHAFVRTPPERTVAGVEYHAVDLLEARSAAAGILARIKPSHMLHLAWYAVPGLYWQARENFRWVAASLDLAEAFAQAGGRRLVVAGSCAEYDWQAAGRFSESSSPLNPSTPYGIAKHSLHTLLETWSRISEIDLAWARLFFTYGPREPQSRLVASVTCTLLQAEGRAAVTEGRQRRDFLHVRDVADALTAVAESAVTGAVNIGSGRATAVADVVAEIGVQTGRRDRISFGAIPSRDEPPLIEADIRRLTEEVRWQPSIDLAAGIADTVRWWRANLKEVGV